MGLFAEPGGVVPAPRTSFTIPPACPLGALSFFIGNCDHILTQRKIFVGVPLVYSDISGRIAAPSKILHRIAQHVRQVFWGIKLGEARPLSLLEP